MSKQINTALAIAVIIIIAGIAGGAIFFSSKKQNQETNSVTERPIKNNASTTTVNTDDKEKQTQQTEVDDALGEFYPIQRIPAVNDKFDAMRYSCQGQKIVSEIEKDSSFGQSPFLWATSVEIMPGNIKLEKIDKSARFISYTFSKDCKNIYSIVRYNNEKVEDIFKFDPKNGKYVQLTKNLSPKWTTLDEAKPSPIFIYSIDNNKLLVSFFGVTTGLDAYTNFTTHKIYNLVNNVFTKEIAFIGDGKIDQSADIWLLPPTILNFKDNILSNAIGLDRQTDGNYKNLKRMDFDLISEKFITTTDLDSNLLKGEDQLSKLFFTCPSKNDELAEYNKCIKENLTNIFPKK
mgnify:CR=1 FL=1